MNKQTIYTIRIHTLYARFCVCQMYIEFNESPGVNISHQYTLIQIVHLDVSVSVCVCVFALSSTFAPHHRRYTRHDDRRLIAYNCDVVRNIFKDTHSCTQFAFAFDFKVHSCIHLMCHYVYDIVYGLVCLAPNFVLFHSSPSTMFCAINAKKAKARVTN